MENPVLTNLERERIISTATEIFFDCSLKYNKAILEREEQCKVVNSLIGTTTPLSLDDYEKLKTSIAEARVKYESLVNVVSDIERQSRVALSQIHKLLPDDSLGVTLKIGNFLYRQYTNNDQARLQIMTTEGAKVFDGCTP